MTGLSVAVEGFDHANPWYAKRPNEGRKCFTVHPHKRMFDDILSHEEQKALQRCGKMIFSAVLLSRR